MNTTQTAKKLARNFALRERLLKLGPKLGEFNILGQVTKEIDEGYTRAQTNEVIKQLASEGYKPAVEFISKRKTQQRGQVIPRGFIQREIPEQIISKETAKNELSKLERQYNRLMQIRHTLNPHIVKEEEREILEKRKKMKKILGAE